MPCDSSRVRYHCDFDDRPSFLVPPGLHQSKRCLRLFQPHSMRDQLLHVGERSALLGQQSEGGRVAVGVSKDTDDVYFTQRGGSERDGGD